MRARVCFVLITSALSSAVALVACSSTSSPSGSAAADAGSPTPGSGAPLTLTRVAHLSPGAPNVDFCLVPHDTAGGFGPVPRDGGLVPQAPIFGSIGLAAGIAYGQVSTYDPGGAPVGSYDFRIVAAGTTDCSSPGIVDFPNVQLPAGHVTIAATGLLGAGAIPAFGLTIYRDDSDAPSSSAALRFINAAPGAKAMKLGVLSTSGLTAIFRDVAYGQVASSVDGGVDPNGYASLSPVPSPGMTIAAAVDDADGAASPSTTIAVTGVTLAAGETATAFAIGQPAGSTDAGTSLGVLLCNDNPSDVGLAFINPACVIAH